MASPKRPTGIRLPTGSRIRLLGPGGVETPEMQAARDGALVAPKSAAADERPAKVLPPKRADGAEWTQDPATKALLHDAPCGGVVLNRQAGASLRRFCRECLREWHRTPDGRWVRVPEARGERGRRG